MTAGDSAPTTQPATTRTHFSESLRINSSGLLVTALQDRLKELGFDPGQSDWFFGISTRQALLAFEALVLGTSPGDATGVLTDNMWQVMQDPIDIKPRRLTALTPAKRATNVEIYLDLQVLIVFTNDKPVLITHISSGSGEAWCALVNHSVDSAGIPLAEPFVRDECGESKTPGGVFWFYLRYAGNHVGPIENMWNPVFFNDGIAVYGNEGVPKSPVSHGGIRIPMFIADYFPNLVENRDRVYVWDGLNEPEDLTTKE